MQGQYSEHIDHYTVLRTLEDMYGLPYAGNSDTAAPITNCWTLPTEIGNIKKHERITLFPNPTTENYSLNFYSNEEQNIKIGITDVLSKTIINIIKDFHPGDNIIQIPTKNMSVGTYFVNVVSVERNVVRKVVIRK